VYDGNTMATTVFVGNQVPLRFSDKGVQTILFRDVGVKLRCLAGLMEDDGRYEVAVKVEDSFLAAPTPASRPAEEDLPVWRTLNAEARLYMRLGDTVPITSTVDPVTGDMVRAEVTLTALK
jgi:hypothetical protein